MSRGEWLGGYAMRLEIAQAWGISENRVRDLSATASLLLRKTPDQLEALRLENEAFFARIKREAVAKRNKITGLPDYMAAMKAAENEAKFAGLDVDAKNGDDGPDMLALRVELTGHVSTELPATPEVSGDTAPPPDGAQPPTSGEP
jgi:hypothetical protein